MPRQLGSVAMVCWFRHSCAAGTCASAIVSPTFAFITSFATQSGKAGDMASKIAYRAIHAIAALQEVADLAAAGRFDYLVIESTGDTLTSLLLGLADAGNVTFLLSN